MEHYIVTKNAFVLIGYGEAGKWGKEDVYPIPKLWEKAQYFIENYQVEKIVGVCLPPRGDHYFYTCGMELEEVDFKSIGEGMTVHTFPEQEYAVFKHIGAAKTIPNTYFKLWHTFSIEGYQIKKGMPEIEVVSADMYGLEEDDSYEMEIWIPLAKQKD